MIGRVGAAPRGARRLGWLWAPETALGRAARLLIYSSPIFILTALGKPVCLVALIAHVPCPGCGLTRATFALLHGDLATATTMNPLAVIVCPLAIGITALGVGRYVMTGRTGMSGTWLPRLGLSLCVALIVVWLARMLGAFGGPVAV